MLGYQGGVQYMSLQGHSHYNNGCWGTKTVIHEFLYGNSILMLKGSSIRFINLTIFYCIALGFDRMDSTLEEDNYINIVSNYSLNVSPNVNLNLFFLLLYFVVLIFVLLFNVIGCTTRWYEYAWYN